MLNIWLEALVGSVGLAVALVGFLYGALLFQDVNSFLTAFFLIGGGLIAFGFMGYLRLVYQTKGLVGE